jgi:excinuclease UvrABC nuclease subunit
MPTPQPAPVTPKVTWLTHKFEVNLQSANWRAIAGLYIFAAKNSEGKWFPLYVGQAESLAARLPTHERWQEAVRLGATHVHARVVLEESTRCEVESQLIQAYQPRLNVHHRQ